MIHFWKTGNNTRGRNCWTFTLVLLDKQAVLELPAYWILKITWIMTRHWEILSLNSPCCCCCCHLPLIWNFSHILLCVQFSWVTADLWNRHNSVQISGTFHSVSHYPWAMLLPDACNYVYLYIGVCVCGPQLFPKLHYSGCHLK